MSFFDTHAHLDDDQLWDQVDDVIQRAMDAGVDGMMSIGTSAASSQRCVELAKKHPCVVAAVGIQPNYVHEAAAGDWESICALAENPVVKAIGETGLDHYWDYAPLDLQREYFRRHIRLANSRSLPLVIHMRDPRDEPESGVCGQDILSLLRNASPTQGIMHSFSGTIDLANECIDMGLFISFAGMVTYKKANALRSVAKIVPADQLLIETDAPYLSPHPKRGQRPNEPALLVHTAECIAEARDITLDELAEMTTRNARKLLGCSD